MPVRAAAHRTRSPELVRRAIPMALVRDLLSVGLVTEYRVSARTRLEKLLGPETTASVLRQTLASGH